MKHLISLIRNHKAVPFVAAFLAFSFSLLWSVDGFAPPIDVDIPSECQEITLELPEKQLHIIDRVLKYEDMIINALQQEDIVYSMDLVAEIMATMAHESGGCSWVRGSSGEVGLMQLMPSTARLMRVNPWVVEQNILGGIRYRKHLRTDFGFTGEKLLAAYNAGPGNVKKGYMPHNYIRSVKKWAKIFIDVLKAEECKIDKA